MLRFSGLEIHAGKSLQLLGGTSDLRLRIPNVELSDVRTSNLTGISDVERNFEE